MRSLLAVAVILAPAPAVAMFAQDASQGDVTVTAERRVCTRVELRGASRISYQRVCRTPAEWRERLGPDWRQTLGGNARSVQDDLDNMDTLSREGGGGSALGSFKSRGGGGPQ